MLNVNDLNEVKPKNLSIFWREKKAKKAIIGKSEEINLETELIVYLCMPMPFFYEKKPSLIIILIFGLLESCNLNWEISYDDET